MRDEDCEEVAARACAIAPEVGARFAARPRPPVVSVRQVSRSACVPAVPVRRPSRPVPGPVPPPRYARVRAGWRYA